MIRSVDLESIPVGFRFHPTDEELVNHYLKSKTLGNDFKVRVIPEVDICKYEPRNLPDVFLRQFHNTFPNCSEIQANDHRWYFFCPRDFKNPNGNNRVNRSTEAGFWKPTGTDRIIKSRDTDTSIGTKKTLVYHTGRVRNSKGTNWVIHEYQLTPDLLNPPKKGFVLCLLKYKKKKNDNTRGEVEPSSVPGSSPSDNFSLPIPNNSRHTNHLASDIENQAPEDLVDELSPEDQAFLMECLYEPTNRQPQMHQEQGFSDMDLLYYNDFSNNNDREEMRLQFHSGTVESIDDSGLYLLSEDEYTLAESRGHRAMAARRSEMPETHLVRVSSDCSITKEYVKGSESSSETDTEVVLQSRVDPIVGTLRSLKSQHRRENVGFLDDESGGSSPASVNSIADKPIEINFRQLRSHNFVAQGTGPGKICVQEVLHKEPKQGKVRESNCITVKDEGRPDSVKERATATKLPQKEKSIVVSNNDWGMAGGGGAKKLSLKPREQEESSGKNHKGGRNFVGTPLASSHESSPPFDYAFNLGLGIILLGLFFVFVVLDMRDRISSVFN